MKIIINFEAENSAFVEDFDSEIIYILKQAEKYLTGSRRIEILYDSNGNAVGHVFRSTILKPKG